MSADRTCRRLSSPSGYAVVNAAAIRAGSTSGSKDQRRSARGVPFQALIHAKHVRPTSRRRVRGGHTSIISHSHNTLRRSADFEPAVGSLLISLTRVPTARCACHEPRTARYTGGVGSDRGGTDAGHRHGAARRGVPKPGPALDPEAQQQPQQESEQQVRDPTLHRAPRRRSLP